MNRYIVIGLVAIVAWTAGYNMSAVQPQVINSVAANPPAAKKAPAVDNPFNTLTSDTVDSLPTPETTAFKHQIAKLNQHLFD
ncbi:MAG: hypothetical protein ACI8WB_004338 [Phenylobacterium sp.]|jgi:hypothetical protein